MGKPKKWSKRVLSRAREVIENNLRRPMVREDQQLELHLQNRAQRGIVISPNEAMLVFLHHHRPRLFWDVSIFWKKLPTTDLFALGERAFDCFRLVLTDAEIKAGTWDQLPTHREYPIFSIEADYVAGASEDKQFHDLVRRDPDWDDYKLSRLTGNLLDDGPKGGGIVVPATADQIRQLNEAPLSAQH